MSARTEQEIMQNWKYTDPPLVSICCITYNHAPYIRDAIEGFLMQETDFPFEIIIHDDASTDGTADIIREYHAQYPNLICPIFQRENQYSKGIKISPTFVWPKARGEYIALCEGDDYWTDSNKLQIQLKEMQKYPECDISFHPALFKYMDQSRKDAIQCQHREKTCIIPLPEVVRGGGGFCPTASLIVKKVVLDNMPEWFYTHAPVGDVFVQIYGAKKGGALFLNKVMSAYRVNVQGSWTQIRSKDPSHALEHFKKMKYSLELAKKDFGEECITILDTHIAYDKFHRAIICLKNNDFFSYREDIESSWKTAKNLNFEHFLAYHFRKNPAIICRMVYFRKIARKLSAKLLGSSLFRVGSGTCQARCRKKIKLK